MITLLLFLWKSLELECGLIFSTHATMHLHVWVTISFLFFFAKCDFFMWRSINFLLVLFRWHLYRISIITDIRKVTIIDFLPLVYAACLVVGRRLLSGSEAFMLHCPHRLILDNPSSSQNLVGIHDIQSFFRITWLFVSTRVLNFS